MRIRRVPVEYKFCQDKDCTSPDPACKYEGARCPWCKTPFAPDKTPKIAEDRFILITDYPIYQREERTHCTDKIEQNGKKVECDNLYLGPQCPISGGKPKVRRPTFVWVRTFNQQLSLDGLDVVERAWIESNVQNEDYDEQEDDDDYWDSGDDSNVSSNRKKDETRGVER